MASHVPGQLARRVVADWQHRWGFAPVLMETFVDPRRYAGTCYRAAGWKLLGETSGHGLARTGKAYQTTPRLVWVEPLAGELMFVFQFGAAVRAGEREDLEQTGDEGGPRVPCRGTRQRVRTIGLVCVGCARRLLAVDIGAMGFW